MFWPRGGPVIFYPGTVDVVAQAREIILEADQRPRQLVSFDREIVTLAGRARPHLLTTEARPYQTVAEPQADAEPVPVTSYGRSRLLAADERPQALQGAARPRILAASDRPASTSATARPATVVVEVP